MKKVILLSLLLILIMLSSCSKQPITSETQKNSVIDATKTISEDQTTNIIEITSDGFTPKELTIKTGDTVTFINKDTKPHWPASAFHPTHTAYPGSGIDKCGTEEQSNIFDACKELQQEETFSFKFEAPGKWNYHDHLRASIYGSIIVQ